MRPIHSHALQFHSIPRPDLLLDVLAVAFHCLDAHLHFLGNLPAAQTRSKQLKHIQLAIRQVADAIVQFWRGFRRGLHGAVEYQNGDLSADVGFTPQHTADGRDHFSRRLLLGDVPVRPGAQAPVRIKHFIMLGKDQDPHAGMPRTHGFDEFDRVAAALEPQIQKQQVRFALLQRGIRLADGLPTAHHHHVVLAVDELDQAFTKQGMVIDDDDSGFPVSIRWRIFHEKCAQTDLGASLETEQAATAGRRQPHTHRFQSESRFVSGTRFEINRTQLLASPPHAPGMLAVSGT